MSYGGGLGAGCLTGGRFTMKATLLHQGDVDGPTPDPDGYGTWVKQQDPLTGEIVRVWVANPDPDPNTPANESVTVGDISCLARGIVDGGIRVAGTTERFGDTYENIDYVKLWVPAGGIVPTKRDRVTNIRDLNGHIVWIDEESIANPAKSTVFNVNGVTPLFDAFNNTKEWFVLLERAEVSSTVA